MTFDPHPAGGADASESNRKRVASKARELQKSVRNIKSEVSGLRQVHALKMAELNASISHTSQRILAAITAFGQAASLRKDEGALQVEKFRKERLELNGLEDGYNRCSQTTFKDLQ